MALSPILLVIDLCPLLQLSTVLPQEGPGV